jgi:hypothetical protein
MNTSSILGFVVRLAGVALVLGGCGSVSSKTSNDGGSAGSIGVAGKSGGAGTIGAAGTSGGAGSSGGAGTSGTAGNSGGAGAIGSAGKSGGAGKTGSAGNGGAGTTGSAGNSGAAGTTGGAGTSGNGGAAGAAAGCGANGSACTAGGFTGGLCESMVCGPCTDTTDDATCTKAYGSASKPYLCLSGTCQPGNCRADADCAGNKAGPLCGPVTPNVCGPCTTDSQCAADNAATPVCNTTTGGCVAGTCTPGATAAPTACSANPSDVCCTTTCQAGPPSGGVACCPTTDSTKYCTNQLNMAATCIGNVCSACPAVTDGNYTVDPVNGRDVNGTGFGAQAGCAFKTITRALEVIDTTLASSITVLGPSTVGAGETFPIVLPAKLALTTSGGAVTVNVPSGDNGFTVNSPGTTLSGATGAPLTISSQGSTTTGTTIGINAFGKSTATTTISNVSITGFSGEGINIGNNATLTIGPGVKSSGNNTGLTARVSGHAIISVPAGSATTSFDSNNVYGIRVISNGNVTLTGSVTSATGGTGTVTANKNGIAGLSINQTPGTPPQNVIDGLVAFANMADGGIELLGGSNAQIRNSATLGNTGSGIIIYAGEGTSAADVSQIDLGTTTSPGLNTVQDKAGGAASNTGTGICLGLLPGSGFTLPALGNIFGSTNCSTTAGKLRMSKSGCAGALDLGVNGSGFDINVTQCTKM